MSAFDKSSFSLADEPVPDEGGCCADAAVAAVAVEGGAAADAKCE